jgi:septum formation protein
MSHPHLILASGSRRRQQFLHELGVDFTVRVADIDETPHPGEDPVAMTRRLAEEKARAVAARLPAAAPPALIVASDTTVVQDGAIFGKPADPTDAVRMLAELRARTHQVVSALCVLDTAGDALHTAVHTTDVTMRSYADAEIADYVASGDPLDKAGAYGIQARAFAPVASVRGCYASVMGLPLADLRDLLQECGVTLPGSVESVCLRYSTFGCCAGEGAKERPG